MPTSSVQSRGPTGIPGPRGMLMALAIASSALFTSSTAIGAEVMNSTAASPVNAVTRALPDLEARCTAEAMQGVASTLSTTVSVKDVSGAAKAGSGVRFTVAKDNRPAFCQVTGSFVTNPATGKTANFLATFPENWNGKYLQMGCSGHCGHWVVSDPAMSFSTVTMQGRPFDAIVKGYASFTTDEGHQGFSGGLWAIKGPGKVDEDAIRDFYYRAQEVLSHMGKEFTTAFYGSAKKAPQQISRSYFSGCSGGGRDALVAASYFPEQFDGIIAGSPYNLLPIAFHSAGIALAQLRAPDALVSAAQLSLIDPIVKAKCDTADGVADGLIQNPAACDFRPERDLPRCDAGTTGDQCFTRAQVETISTVLTAVTDKAGKLVQPAYSVSELQPFFTVPNRPADLAAQDPWPNADSNVPMATTGGMWTLADAVLKVFVRKNDPKFFTRSTIGFGEGGKGPATGFRVVVDRSEVDHAVKEVRGGMGHIPENAATLIEQDRKLMIWHNLSDEKLSPYMSINYYKQLATLHGGYDKLQKNVRLFSLPGTAHCSVGGAPVGPGSFDALTAMENWVEHNQAPDSLPATLFKSTIAGADFNSPLGRTMPLCKFPEMARYSGTGDVKDGANWSCPPDDTRMLEIGESGRQAGVID